MNNVFAFQFRFSCTKSMMIQSVRISWTICFLLCKNEVSAIFQYIIGVRYRRWTMSHCCNSTNRFFYYEISCFCGERDCVLSSWSAYLCMALNRAEKLNGKSEHMTQGKIIIIFIRNVFIHSSIRILIHRLCACMCLFRTFSNSFTCLVRSSVCVWMWTCVCCFLAPVK